MVVSFYFYYHIITTIIMAERMLNAALKEIFLMKDVEKQRLAVKTLFKLASNVHTKPTETKYHRIRPDNPQIKSRIFDIKGGRTALRGIGFGLSECGEFYEYRGAPLEKCCAILENALNDITGNNQNSNSKNQENTADGGNTQQRQVGKNPSRSYVERQGPRSNDFKRFKSGIEGLYQRWSETAFVLSKGAPKTEGQYVITEKAVQVCNEFLELLEATAKEYNCLQGYIYQHLVHKMESGDKSIINEMLENDSETCDAIINGAETFRTTLRVKIADDADLDTARRAVIDTMEFFRLLNVESDKLNITGLELLSKLDA